MISRKNKSFLRRFIASGVTRVLPDTIYQTGSRLEMIEELEVTNRSHQHCV